MSVGRRVRCRSHRGHPHGLRLSFEATLHAAECGSPVPKHRCAPFFLSWDSSSACPSTASPACSIPETKASFATGGTIPPKMCRPRGFSPPRRVHPQADRRVCSTPNTAMGFTALPTWRSAKHELARAHWDPHIFPAVQLTPFEELHIDSRTASLRPLPSCCYRSPCFRPHTRNEFLACQAPESSTPGAEPCLRSPWPQPGVPRCHGGRLLGQRPKPETDTPYRLADKMTLHIETTEAVTTSSMEQGLEHSSQTVRGQLASP